MVGHQYIGVHRAAGFLGGFSQTIQIGEEVLIVKKTCAAVVEPDPFSLGQLRMLIVNASGKPKGLNAVARRGFPPPVAISLEAGKGLRAREPLMRVLGPGFFP
jgi:hypothetical protein